jgi:intracellular sulfur oxidation DsrE/DsrF family protein
MEPVPDYGTRLTNSARKGREEAMTQLQKAIAKLQRGTGPGIGFGQVKRDAPRTLLLAVEVENSTAAKAALEAGADFFIARGPNAATTITETAKNDRAAARVDELDDSTAKALKAAGAIFVACEPSRAQASAIDTDELGFVAIVDAGLEEQTLRALAGLGLDGLATLTGSTPETLADQLQLVRLAQLGGAPVLSPVTAGATTAQLRVLRDSGVALVVAGVSSSAEDVAGLVAAIKALPPRKKKGDGGDIAMIPSMGARQEEEHDHEEGDDDE